MAEIYHEPGFRILAIRGHHGDAPAVIYRIEGGGRSITFSGDIDPKGHAALKSIAQGSDLLVFNSVVLDPPQSPAILYELHTAPSDIGQLARTAAIHRLLLAHLNPAIDAHRDEFTRSIKASFDGDLDFATDGMEVTP